MTLNVGQNKKRKPADHFGSPAFAKPPKLPSYGSTVFAGSAPAARAPAAAAAPASTPPPKFDINNLPVDPAYDMQVGGFGKTRDNTLDGLAGQKTSTLADYGYKATYDDKGDVASLAVDPSNPYSKAALLKKNYDQSKTGTTNGFAARGQLYSGAQVDAQNNNDSNFLQGDNSLRRDVGQIIAGIIGQERTARTDFETSSGVAYGERIGRAQSNPLYNPGSGDAPAADAAAAKPGLKVDPSKWVSTSYKNAQGHPVKVFADGHKEVQVNGTWKRV